MNREGELALAIIVMVGVLLFGIWVGTVKREGIVDRGWKNYEVPHRN
jgi:hypothetical protein